MGQRLYGTTKKENDVRDDHTTKERTMARRKSSVAGESLAARRHNGGVSGVTVNKKTASEAASRLGSARTKSDRPCEHCGKITPMLKQQLYCSGSCRQKAKYRKDPARYKKAEAVARQNKKATD